MHNPKLHSLLKRDMTRKEFLRVGFIGVLSVFGVTGIVAELLSHASTPTASEESEAGSVTGGSAGVVTDSTASAKKAVKFGAATQSLGHEPTGSQYISYSTLAGATFNAKVNSAPKTKIVSFAPGTFSWSGFPFGSFGPQTSGASGYGKSSMGGYGVDYAGAGFAGAGITSTILEIAPNSMTQDAPNVDNTSVTNGLSLIRATGANVVMQDFTLLGTDQGGGSYSTSTASAWVKKCFNGLRFEGVSGATVQRVLLKNAGPGWLNEPAGETFALNDYKGSGNSYTDVEVDAQDKGGSGIGLNSTTNITMLRVKSHGLIASAGMAFWKTSNVTLTDCEVYDNHTGFVVEQCTGTFTFNRVSFHDNVSKDIYFGALSSSRATIIFKDCILPAGKKLVVYYPTDEGSSRNTQTKSDVQWWVSGVKKTTSDYVTFSGSPIS